MTQSRLPSLADFADAEHCVLEDVTIEHPALGETLRARRREAREVTEAIVINDRLRGRATSVRIYAEGWMDIRAERRGKRRRHHRFDLRYLDPAPEHRRHRPVRLLKAAGVLAAVTALLGVPAFLGLLASYTAPAAAVAAGLTLAALFWVYYVSHETIFFYTMNGRAVAIRFGAGLGTIGRFRRLVPRISAAIRRAARAVDEDRATYLRSEMREHYRLRGDGLLSDEECAAATGRILSRFDHTG